MSDVKVLFNKILTVAINPGAADGEAINALGKLREMVKKYPSLSAPSELPPASTVNPAPKTDYSIEYNLTNISPFWGRILLNTLSEKAHALNLKSKLISDYEEAINVRCDGPKEACVIFINHMNWWIQYINTQPRHP